MVIAWAPRTKIEAAKVELLLCVVLIGLTHDTPPQEETLWGSGETGKFQAGRYSGPLASYFCGPPILGCSLNDGMGCSIERQTWPS